MIAPVRHLTLSARRGLTPPAPNAKALLSGVFWYWVKSISKQRDVDRADVEYIKREYVRRDDHRIETSRVYDLLKEIKSQLQKVDDKLDKKADK